MALHSFSPTRWFKAEDQEFFRREFRLSARWLARGSGAGWIAGYIACLLLQSLLVVNVHPGVTGYGPLTSAIRTTIEYGWVFILPGFFAVAACAETLKARTFAPLSGKRGEALAVSDLRAEQLWPALLIAPILLQGVLIALAAGTGIATYSWWLFTEGPVDPADSRAIGLGFKIYGALLGFLISGTQAAASTAWAACWIHPGGSRVRTLLLTLLSVLVFYVLNAATIFLSQAAVFMRWDHFFALNLRDPRLYLPYHLAFLPGVVFRIALFGLLFWMAVRRLRSPVSTERWRRRLEA